MNVKMMMTRRGGKVEDTARSMKDTTWRAPMKDMARSNEIYGALKRYGASINSLASASSQPAAVAVANI